MGGRGREGAGEAVANAMVEYKNAKGVERLQLRVASTTLIVR